MREIKFRVYNSQEGMIYDNLDCFISINRDGSLNDSGIPINQVMQFTGLKDKNGKEIYEGDKVKILYTDWGSENDYFIGEVVFNDSSWEIKFPPNKYGFENYNTIDSGKHGWIEVIGNIHEDK